VAVVSRGAIYQAPESCKDFLYPGCLIGSDFLLGVPLMVILTIKECPCVEGVSEDKETYLLKDEWALKKWGRLPIFGTKMESVPRFFLFQHRVDSSFFECLSRRMSFLREDGQAGACPSRIHEVD